MRNARRFSAAETRACLSSSASDSIGSVDFCDVVSAADGLGCGASSRGDLRCCLISDDGGSRVSAPNVTLLEWIAGDGRDDSSCATADSRCINPRPHGWALGVRVGAALTEGAARPPVGGCEDAAPPRSFKSFASSRARRLDILRVDALDVIARGWRPWPSRAALVCTGALLVLPKESGNVSSVSFRFRVH